MEIRKDKIRAMSKKIRILLTLTAIVSIIVIVVTVVVVKTIIEVQAEKNENFHPGDKAVMAFSTRILTTADGQLTKIEPQIDRKQKKINDYATAIIQYKFGDQEEFIDKDLITQWIYFKDDKIVLDEQKVQNYVENLAKKYDTVGKERQFVDSHGERVTVSGGTYGWKIDCDKETQALIDIINKGMMVKDREPIYKQKARTRETNDIGNTYVEVNMSEQKMWFYKDGELIVSTDIVTGNRAKGHDTPTVVGYIYNKKRNINLVGTGYVAFVHYWMKVYGSIGIHDASWRSKFGGKIYTTNGSHGCINTPYDKVKLMYDNIEVGTPVIIFYES